MNPRDHFLSEAVWWWCGANRPGKGLRPTPACASIRPENSARMKQPHSDALVFFGATSDLAKDLPVPQARMIKQGHLNIPVIGVAKTGWDLTQLRARQDSPQHGGLDAAAFGNCPGSSGTWTGLFDAATFQALKEDPWKCQATRPLPGYSAPAVREGSGSSWLPPDAPDRVRESSWRSSFGTDLTSAQNLEPGSCSAPLMNPGSSASTTTSGSAGPQPPVLPLRQRISGSYWNRSHIEALQITMG